MEVHTYYREKLQNAIYFEFDKGAAEPFSGRLESYKEFEVPRCLNFNFFSMNHNRDSKTVHSAF